MDASVLIDYLDADLAPLALANRHLGPLHAVSSVLREEVGRFRERR